MDLFNRILIIVLALAMMAIALLLLLPVLNLIQPENIGLPLWLAENIRPIIESHGQTRLVLAGILSVAFFSGVVLLCVELRTLFSPEPRFLILRDELGKVEITESCIRNYISYEARLFNQISGVKSQVFSRKDGLFIKSTVFVKPDTKIKEITQNLQEKLKSNLENNLGILISQISIVAKINSEPSISKRALK